METRVYKILTEPEWMTLQQKGRFRGSDTDLRDGFIHLSTRLQVSGVIERYFAGVRPLYVAEFSDPAMIQSLKWEASDSNDIYPHLYTADLYANDVTSVEKIPATAVT